MQPFGQICPRGALQFSAASLVSWLGWLAGLGCQGPPDKPRRLTRAGRSRSNAVIGGWVVVQRLCLVERPAQKEGPQIEISIWGN